MPRTHDLHVTNTMNLTTPRDLRRDLPMPADRADGLLAHRAAIRQVIHGADRRLLVIVGPCSIHDPAAARDYADRLAGLAAELSDDLLIAMRVYFEKPRTTVGWKGLINDPHLDGSHDVETGIRLARELLLDIDALGLPTATEFLDPIIPQYLGDLIAWAAIGARTTESQTHRELASGLSMPVGFKNGTDGSLQVAINAMLSAQAPHRFLGIDQDGRVSMVSTDGNRDCHAVLRGGAAGPNYSRTDQERAASALRAAGCNPRVLVDCSHDNSGKDPQRQGEVVAALAAQVSQGNPDLLGLMLESHLSGGRQTVEAGRPLVYGQSITDGCIDFATTTRLLRQIALAHHRRPAAVA